MSGFDQLEALAAEVRVAAGESRSDTAALRRQAEQALMRFQSERARLQADQAEHQHGVARAARAGELGPARREVQQRIDLGRTTWRDVMSGQDQHWSAADVRAEVIGDARRTIDELEKDDPEFSASYREVAPLRAESEPGEW